MLKALMVTGSLLFAAPALAQEAPRPGTTNPVTQSETGPQTPQPPADPAAATDDAPPGDPAEAARVPGPASTPAPATQAAQPTPGPSPTATPDPHRGHKQPDRKKERNRPNG